MTFWKGVGLALTAFVVAIMPMTISTYFSSEKYNEQRALDRAWEKQKYLGDLDKTLCEEKRDCEPLSNFRDTLRQQVRGNR